MLIINQELGLRDPKLSLLIPNLHSIFIVGIIAENLRKIHMRGNSHKQQYTCMEIVLCKVTHRLLPANALYIARVRHTTVSASPYSMATFIDCVKCTMNKYGICCWYMDMEMKKRTARLFYQSNHLRSLPWQSLNVSQAISKLMQGFWLKKYNKKCQGAKLLTLDYA